jgi:hypothetical protein
MSVSTGWQVEQSSWRAGIRLRFSRSVEFDPATHSYAVLEALEITPAVRFKIVSLARATTVLVRRTGYTTWERALFARPSRWLFGDRPNKAEEAQQLAPGTADHLLERDAVLRRCGRVDAPRCVPVEGSRRTVRIGRVLHAGGAPAARLRHLRESGMGRFDGWVDPRGLEAVVNMRSPEILWGKTVRVLESHWRASRGARFLFRAGPLDLGGDPEAADFLRVAMEGVAPFRFYDVPLIGANLDSVRRHRPLGPDLLKRLDRFPNVKRIRAAAQQDPEGIPFVESISRFTPRKHGEMGFGLWAGLYGLNFTSNWYAEESWGVPTGRPSSVILSYPAQRRSDRGWVFFPRETQDLQMITVQDGRGGDLITEVSLELEDARARVEARVASIGSRSGAS